MRRFLMLALFVATLVSIPALAQRGGLRGGGNGRGVSIGHASGARSFGVMGARPSHSFSGHGFRGDRFHNRSFGHCFGCRRRYGYPFYQGYGYAGYYDPFWWDSPSSYDYDEDQARETAIANEENAVSLQEQRLRAQDDRERSRDEELDARRSRSRAERPEGSPSTAIVFRDQHVEEVRNYAIAGGTLWVLNEQAAKKIPLAQLDLQATAKMNDDRGVDFQIPK